MTACCSSVEFNVCKDKIDQIAPQGSGKGEEKLKLIWNWAKTGHINFKLFLALMEYVKEDI